MKRVRNWRVAVYTVLEHSAWAADLASRAFTYIAAGFLRPQELQWAITQRWQDFGSDERFVDSGFMAWERNLYLRFLKPEDEILVVGCGSGRDLLALLRGGFNNVEGLEPAHHAATKARRHLLEHGFSAPIAIEGIETVTLRKPYDAY